jgi:hypothetical protein
MLCPSFLPHYSRLPLRPVLTDTTSKFSHKLSSISANRRHEHTQTHTHKYDHLIQISLSKKEQKQIHDSSCCCCLKLPNSKQANKQTNKHFSRFLKSCQGRKQTNISRDSSNPVKLLSSQPESQYQQNWHQITSSESVLLLLKIANSSAIQMATQPPQIRPNYNREIRNNTIPKFATISLSFCASLSLSLSLSLSQALAFFLWEFGAKRRRW